MTDKLLKKIEKVNDRIEKIGKKWEFIGILVFSLLFVFGVIIGMGTLTCGFHLVDDHEFAEWVYQMKYEHISLFEVIKSKVMLDFGRRYRPLYYTLRIFGCYFFGINLTAYAVIRGFEIALASVFLYYCGKHMGGSKIQSLLFSLITLVGYQSAVWWKLGPQESLGTLLFAAGFYCMLRWLENARKKGMAILSILLFFLMVNYKESYVILVPFIMLYVLYYELNREEQKISWKRIWGCIKKRLVYLLALALCFLIPVIVMVTYVGLHNYGNVGLDANSSLSEYVDGIRMSFQKDLKWYLRFGILFSLILLTYWENLKKLWKEMLLAVVLVLPQFVLYGKAGVTERYILPAAIGFAYFFVIVILKWKPLSGKRRVVYVLGMLLLLAAHGRVMLREADYFRYRGDSITAMLESVYEMADEDINVLSCFRPNEEGNLTINYWMKLHDFENVYYWTEESKTITKVCDVNLPYDESYYEEQAFEDMDIIVMYNEEDRHWCYEPSLDLSDFTEYPCGTLTIYVRNNSVENVIEPQVKGLKIHF